MKHPTRRKLLLAASLTTNLGVLAFFKYANFILGNTHSLLNWLGIEISLGALNIILPVGISFFTFQSMSYTIDVYRGHLPPCRRLSDFLLFVSFFPQLVAGPIVRAADLLPQFNKVNVYGLELATAIRSFTVRTEWAYIQGAYHTVDVTLDNVLQIVDIPSVEQIAGMILENLITTGQARAVVRLDPNLSLKRDAIQGGVGVDYLWGNHLITAQVLVNHIRQYDRRLLMDEFDVFAALNLRFSWLYDSLNADLTGMYNFSERSLVLTPEVAYRFTPNLRGSVRAVYIEGPRDTFIGQYRGNDQVMVRLRYSF